MREKKYIIYIENGIITKESPNLFGVTQVGTAPGNSKKNFFEKSRKIGQCAQQKKVCEKFLIGF